MTLEIEPAQSADVAVVTDMWVSLACGQRAYDSAIRADENRERMRETLAAHAAADALLVARLDGTVVGFASFSIERGALELDVTRGTLSNLYVDPDYRDQGIGTALLEEVEASLAERGVDVVRLEVMAANESARRFYRKRGYDPHRLTMGRSIATDDGEQ
ncbi:GNAT family N-acetyltransferase [Natrarchaeobaculum aegyptiacum]|uniref:N-acetyltransferase n=1 Tax=Natrarchaeobaculum aegyptiacum TaxID=745377 RepID=A0A2Z2HYS2_9EURY|nr:GNAT family N-acetyltransferase [Natrarchaeobaculum aegyptiacum]ARS88718.1 N-acetyltransferase [Natrarchaeobaculum aegyptiacum]